MANSSQTEHRLLGWSVCDRSSAGSSAPPAPGRTSWALPAPGTHLDNYLTRSHLLSLRSLCLQVTSTQARVQGRAQRRTRVRRARASRPRMPSSQTLPTIREAKTKSNSNPRPGLRTSCNWPLCDGLGQKHSSPQTPKYPWPFHGKPRTKWTKWTKYGPCWPKTTAGCAARERRE